ncbi:MAG: PIN domain-containing protein [Oscillospiraceae bacterium]|nr:PIN domain-containing protein [Oscillospiraceae bacterium]
MKVLIDTNIILDVFMKREPHFEFSDEVLRLCPGQLTGHITTNQTTDIFFVMRRFGKTSEFVKEILKKLTDNLKVMDVTVTDVKNALDSSINDYEDALLAFGSKRYKLDYIITRNLDDFIGSPVPAISPQAFLEQFYSA